MENMQQKRFYLVAVLLVVVLSLLTQPLAAGERPTKEERGYGEDPQPAERQVIGWGQQTRGDGQEGKLEGEPFRITRPARIESVSSADAKIHFRIEEKDLNEDNVGAGFWLQDANGTVHRFDRTTYLKLKMGCVLPPGEYRVYPNLPDDVASAEIHIIVKTQ